jgi:MarR family transcriptional regulator, organic hydroperoxide resistance regulator
MTEKSATTQPSRLQAEIGQTKPFESPAEEALLGVARTASLLDRALMRALAPHKLSPAQYNVLRILRGAGPGGLPTMAIRCRMIDPSAAITRLIDKLERAGLAARSRLADDRREVRCRISAAGLALLTQLDPVLAATNARLAEEIPEADLKRLIHLLDQLRDSVG